MRNIMPESGKIHPRRLLSIALVITLALLLIIACTSKPPKKERESAEKAYIAAKFAEKCAPMTYKSARQALEKARRLTTEKKYDEARLHFASAEQLFKKAKKQAKANTDCMNPPLDKDKNLIPDGSESDKERDEFDDQDYKLRMIHFPFNSDELTEEAQDTLQKNGKWMTRFPDCQITIEGHCDNRGSTQYNLSLGERRANAVVRFLTALGVSPDRLQVLSYGEEKPLLDEFTEEAWGKNRRAEFRKQF